MILAGFFAVLARSEMLRMLFTLKQVVRKWLRRKVSNTPTLGPRSSLLLAKLGFDMRPDYEAVLQEPLPQDLWNAVQQLRGAHDRDVIDLRSRNKSDPLI